MKHSSIKTSAAALFTALLVANAPADWPLVHLNTSNNASTGAAAIVTDLAPGAFWNTGPQDINTACRPIVAGNRVYTVAMQNSPERIWIRAFDTSNGLPAGESGNLDSGVSVSFVTASSPSVDTGAGALYYNTGSTVYCLSTTDLSQNWGTVVDATNTSAAPEAVYTFLNASPSIGDGRIYTRTYPLTFGSVEGSQVIAMDQTTGAVQWYALVGGRGTASPLYVDLGATKLVVSERMTVNTTVELVAFNANSSGAGTPVWTISAPLAAPSTGGASNHGQWAEPVFDSGTGKIFGITSNFSGGRLYRVDAATGTLDWQVDVPGSDVPPVLVGGEILVLDGFNQLSRYDPANGAAIGTPVVVVSSFVFRDYVAATSTGFFLAKSGEGLRYISPTGTTLSSTVATDFGGPVSIDVDNGHVYAYRTNGSLSVFTGVSSVADWLVLE